MAYISVTCRAVPRIIRALAVSLALVFLSGCSAIKLGYNNAQSITYWWLESYLDFTEPQSQQLRASLAILHNWHRAQELPAYIGTLQKLQDMAPKPLNAAQACAVWTEVRGHLNNLGLQAADGLAALTPTLQPDQLTHLTQQFEKRNKTWREDWLESTPAARNSKRLKLAVERAEGLYGRLNEVQITLLRQRIAESTFDPTLIYRETLRRQQDIVRTLKEHSSSSASVRPAHVKAELLALIERSLNPTDPAYSQQALTIANQSCATVAALHNSASPAQRRKAGEVLKDYEADARLLQTQ